MPKSQSTLRPEEQSVLQFERTIRAQKNADDLTFHLVNDFPNFLGAEQAFAFKAKNTGAKRVLAAGSTATVNRESELISALEAALKPVSMTSPESLKLSAIKGLEAMPYALTLPFGPSARSGLPEAVVLAGSKPWSANATELATYIADVYAHAFRSFATTRKRRFAKLKRIGWFCAALMILAALALIPAPITVISPARVMSSVSMPAAPSLDGTVEEVFVERGQIVERGSPLFQLRDSVARAELDEVRAKLLVAQARETQLRAEAIRNPISRQELKVAEAEKELAVIEVERVEEYLSRHVIVAPRSGMVIGDAFASLEGTPLSFGDAPMHVVDPKHVQIQVDVNISDSAVVFHLESARIFFNDAPTSPQALTLKSTPFEPIEDARGGVSYPMLFTLTDADTLPPLGAEGAVQLSGVTKPLGYVLLRRPLQWVAVRLPW